MIRQTQAAQTIGGLWAMWLSERAADGFSNAIYSANWKAMAPHFGHRYPKTLTLDDCRDYARDRFKSGISAWTVRTELSRLRSCLKWAADTDRITKAPKVWVPQAGPGRDRVLTQPELARLIATACEDWVEPHAYLFTILLISTGARHRAILDLTWDRVNFEAGTIQYDEDLPPDPMSKAWRKGRATVLMTRVARQALLRAHAGRQTDFVIEWNGRRVQKIRRAFHSIVVRAGLWTPADRITPHTIRHTVATLLDAASVDRRRTAQLLGHADERTTALIYTHAAPDVLVDAVRVLDGVLDGGDEHYQSGTIEGG